LTIILRLLNKRLNGVNHHYTCIISPLLSRQSFFFFFICFCFLDNSSSYMSFESIFVLHLGPKLQKKLAKQWHHLWIQHKLKFQINHMWSDLSVMLFVFRLINKWCIVYFWMCEGIWWGWFDVIITTYYDWWCVFFLFPKRYFKI
jgi:hypothetical protein